MKIPCSLSHTIVLFHCDTQISDFASVSLKQWSDPEDRFGLVGLGFAAIVALWASTNLITVIAAILFP